MGDDVAAFEVLLEDVLLGTFCVDDEFRRC